MTCHAHVFPLLGWCELHMSPPWAPVLRFPAFGIGCLFSRVWHRLPVFPRLASVTCFPALGIGYLFPRAWHRLPAFPRFASVACFPALGTGYMFSLISYPDLSRRFGNVEMTVGDLGTRLCFPVRGTGFSFSRVWHRYGRLFSRALHRCLFSD